MRLQARSKSKIRQRHMTSRSGWIWAFTALCFLMLSVRQGERKTFAQDSPMQPTSTGQLGISPEEPVAPPQPIIVKVPAANAPGGKQKGQSAEQAPKFVPPAIPDPDPNNPMALQTTNLLKMAYDLKSEVDKTTKDTLSVAVVRRASEIEQLAHKMRAK